MANIANSLRSSALEWYTSELDDQKRERHHRDSSVDSWITILSRRFKVPTSVTLGYLINESYFLHEALQSGHLAQYVRAIIRHGIGCNIVDTANQLLFAY